MIGRRPRELQVFNLSMLDVMSSALGAVLILFVISQGDAESGRGDLRQRDEQLERITAALAASDEALRARSADVDAARDRAAQAADDARAAQLECPPAGLSIGMCRVEGQTVRVHFFDHRKLDGDRVDVFFNRKPLASDVRLTGERASRRHTLHLREGTNYLMARALDEGTEPTNTATVIVSPCRDGRSEAFRWDMTAGEQRHISIVRPPPAR